MGRDILPASWDEKILIGIAIAFLATFLAVEIVRDRSEAQFIKEVDKALGVTSEQTIRKITIRLWVCCGKENPIELSRSKWADFSHLLKTLKPSESFGWRGQPWHHFREIEVETDDGTYRILFSTRRTMSKLRVLATIKLPVIGDNSQYFEATELWHWLSLQPEVSAQGPISLLPAEE